MGLPSFFLSLVYWYIYQTKTILRKTCTLYLKGYLFFDTCNWFIILVEREDWLRHNGRPGCSCTATIYKKHDSCLRLDNFENL